MGASQEHIVMLPFMAQGHLIPSLTLAKHIQQRTGFKITIATTPLNIKYIKSNISKEDEDNNIHLHFAELSFSSTDYGLPPNTENTENLPPHKVGDLLHASVNLEAPARRLISDIIEKEGRPPLCIISHVFFGWATNVANSLGTVNVTRVSCAYGTAAMMSIWLTLSHRSTNDEYFTPPGFPERCRFRVSELNHHLRVADGTDPWSRFLQTQFSLSLKSFGWLFNTAEEIEPSGLEILRNYFKIPVWSIGPLRPATKNTSKLHAGKELGLPAEKCLEWLDSHDPESVIYISFGSQNTIGVSQMMEFAIGLEESGRPFIWVIRPPVGHDLKGEFKAEWLPLGFEERMSKTNQGLLVHNWAPQLQILSHKSTRVFVSHCGWNSVIDSLSQGVPIIAWPLAAEQPYNAKMLVEEMGVAVELAVGMQSPIVGKEVKRLIDLVMDDSGKGGEIRKKAAKISEHIRAAISEEGEDKGSSIKAMDDFVATLLSNRSKLSQIE